MVPLKFCPSAIWVTLFLSFFIPARAEIIDFLEQSWFFNYDSAAVPVPVTTQCDTLHVTWDRSTATGPNPTAPYYLQIYTSAYVFPFIIDAGSGLSYDFQVPFAPGTLYQICMFDKNGNTGGCQGIYTVIANQTSTELSCSNSTLSFPLGPLDVDAQVNNGPLSQYGWVDQCTDIMVTPKNGTPPYTFTAAPSLHPPYNITSEDGSSINWTVTLSWASPFFVSVADSAGNYWSNGPLHSGGSGPTSCLAGKTESGPVSTGAAVGIGIGGLVAGAVAGILAAFCFYRYRSPKSRTAHLMYPDSSPTLTPYASFFTSSSRYKPVPVSPISGGHYMDTSVNSQGSGQPMLTPGQEYHVEPFIMPDEQHPRSSTMPRSPASIRESSSNPFSGSSAHGHEASSATARSSNQVYVVHHDGGRAPVTVYHQDGTEVVELPPRYAHGAQESHSGTGSATDSDGRATSPTEPRRAPSFLQQHRRPDTVPRKRPESQQRT